MGAPDPQTFRAAMANLPTGVTVVTAPGPDGPLGATAGAVSSLSLEPPMMLAALDRSSRTLGAARDTRRFGIAVLEARQESVARSFATKAPHAEKWADVPWSERAGVPVPAEVVLWVACELAEDHDGGDHVILTGRVLELEAPGGEPLVFWDGRYTGLGG